jgi:hypothetical protein
VSEVSLMHIEFNLKNQVGVTQTFIPSETTVSSFQLETKTRKPRERQEQRKWCDMALGACSQQPAPNLVQPTLEHTPSSRSYCKFVE